MKAIANIVLAATIVSLLSLQPASAEPPSDPSIVETPIATWQQIEASIANTPLAVVDLWSLSCAPCLQEFPHLVALQESHGDKVHCVGVSVDYDGRRRRPAETYTARVTAFLKSVSAERVQNFVCGTASDDVLEQVGVASIPTVLIYQNGAVVRKFVDAGETAGFTYEADVIPAVEELLLSATK